MKQLLWVTLICAEKCWMNPAIALYDTNSQNREERELNKIVVI